MKGHNRLGLAVDDGEVQRLDLVGFKGIYFRGKASDRALATENIFPIVDGSKGGPRVLAFKDKRR